MSSVSRTAEPNLTAGSPARDAQAAREALSSAGALLARGQLADAKIAYLNILEGNRCDLTALLQLARIERGSGNHEAARSYLDDAVAHYPDDPEALADLASVLLDLGRLEKAEAVYCRILERDSHDVPSNMGLGAVFRTRQNEEASRRHFTAAMETLRAAAETKPDLTTLALLATTLRELERFDEAEAVFRRILQNHPAHSPSHMALGHMARKRGFEEESIAHFRAACELNPDEMHPRIVLGKVLTEMRRYEEAERVFHGAIKLVPDHAEVHEALGRLAANRRDWPAALQHYRAASATDSAGVAVCLGLGQAYRELEEWENSAQAYHRILARVPENIEALLGLAHTTSARGDAVAALNILEKAALLNPLDSRAKRGIQKLKRHEAGNDWKYEIETALAAVDQPEAPVQTRLEAAETLVNYGLTEAARPVLEQLAARFPSARQILLTARQIDYLGLSQTLAEATGTCASPEDHIDAVRGFTEVPVPGADTLLIVFCGANNRFSITLSLLHRILRRTGVSIVYCRDLEEAYYVHGIVGLGDDFRSTVAGLRQIVSRYGAKRTLMLGHCLGVAGALRCGFWLQAKGVLGLGPRAETELKLHDKMRLRNVRADMPTGYKKIHLRYLETEKRPTVDLFWGSHYSAELGDLQAMTIVPGVEITAIPESYDPVKDLLVRGLLEPLLRDFIANGAVSPEIRAQIASSSAPD